MLKKQYRLKNRVRIQQVLSGRLSWANRWVVVVKARNEQAPVASRFAFVASRRLGSAVKRNRVKRLLRESVRRQLSQIEPGWDIVIIARQPAGQSSFHQLDRAVTGLFSQAHLKILGSEFTARECVPGEHDGTSK